MKLQPFPRVAGLPPHRQWVMLGAVAAAGAALFIGAPLAGHLFAARAATAPVAPPPGTFQATDEQWATLGLQQVGRSMLQPGLETDGKIATDDERTTPVFSPFSGKVTRVFAKAGDRVKAGQPLFEVLATELAQGAGDLASASAQVKLAEANETRLHALYDTAGGALKDWRQSQADLATAKANLAAARGKLKAMGEDEAQIAKLQASGDAEAVVTAPIDGVVTQRAVSPGQTIASVTSGGAAPAMTVSDLNTVWLVANVREADSEAVRLGAPLQVRVLALPGKTFKGTVDYVAPGIDPATRRLTVRAAILNPGGDLEPEMFARFAVATGPEQSAVLAPEQAVIFEEDTARVWVARPSDKSLTLRQVTTGQIADGEVQVVAGLSPGEWIVTSGSLFIDRASRPD